MRSKSRRFMLYAMLVVFMLGFTFTGASSTWAGPYLLTSVEMSIARSTKECGGHATKALRSLQKKRMLQVDNKNKLLGWTKDSTMGVQCIFVGKNEHRRDQWIFQISIASTNLKESKKLLKMLRKELRRTVRID